VRELWQPAPVGDITDLFIGSLGCAFNRPALDACRVTHILTVGCNIRARYPGIFTYKVVPGKHADARALKSATNGHSFLNMRARRSRGAYI
jgi:hypothetical protein